MLDTITTLRSLWRGESATFEGPDGKPVQIRTLPRPVQQDIPIWITTAGNPETYRQAAEQKAYVLTHLLGQSVEELAEKIRLYRETWAACGHEGEGHVTLLLHTLVGEDEDTVRELARGPMKNYLKSAVFLVKAAAWNFPTFKKLSEESGQTLDEYFENMPPEDMDALLDFAFERYYETSGLFGTPDRCLQMVDKLKDIGVNEIGCLIDFGAPTQVVLDHLPSLNQVRKLANPASTRLDAHRYLSIEELCDRYAVTHLQCTPSMAGMLVADSGTRKALSGLRQMMVGGEALNEQLAQQLATLIDGRLSNMYGPTETTIWSTTHDIQVDDLEVSIGRPIANTSCYVLDEFMQPVPAGHSGELFIGGDGVVRGYHDRDDLNRERFLPDPFRPGGRMYKTGDRVYWRDDGTLMYMGRMDNQIKILGYRIEPGEIESLLRRIDGIHEAAVILREDRPGDKRLVAYLKCDHSHKPAIDDVRHALAAELPEFMVPSLFVYLEEMPLTANNKIDRNALPAPDAIHISRSEYIAPHTETENRLAGIWKQVLEVEQISATDNFFDLGGHSLTAIQVIHMIRQTFDIDLSLQAIFRYPLLASLAEHVDEGIIASSNEADIISALRALQIAGHIPAQARNTPSTNQ